MSLRRMFVLFAVAALAPVVVSAADPSLNAGSKIRGDYYHGAPNQSRSVRSYSLAPRSVVVTPQVAPQAAPQIAKQVTPAPNAVAQNDGSQRQGTRTFSIQPNTQVQAQPRTSMRYAAPRRAHGWNVDANRKILGRYMN